ncbi:zinc ribbon domain-containing protein [Lysinibacillus xylanilyticus]|uniref:zinc ribbon domain-containing protein n=2 Tax=Lysinibacillus xylanilyticus TaxID=582475 RepID=UPI003830103C
MLLLSTCLPDCGFVHNKVRKEVYRPTQEQFKCINCKHEANADLNAARYIAMDDIEEIIKKQIEVQKQQKEQAKQYEDISA